MLDKYDENDGLLDDISSNDEDENELEERERHVD